MKNAYVKVPDRIGAILVALGNVLGKVGAKNIEWVCRKGPSGSRRVEIGVRGRRHVWEVKANEAVSFDVRGPNGLEGRRILVTVEPDNEYSVRLLGKREARGLGSGYGCGMLYDDGHTGVGLEELEWVVGEGIWEDKGNWNK